MNKLILLFVFSFVLLEAAPKNYDLDWEHQLHKVGCEKWLQSIGAYPEGKYNGRGVVVSAGGEKYLTNAWINLNFLRDLGCQLPVEVWYIGQEEITDQWIELFKTIDVECKDITKVYPNKLASYAIKPFALVASSFEEVLMLDADNCPLRDPTFLFEEESYLNTGALFWPDLYTLLNINPVWDVLQINARQISSQESGQMVVNKKKCWRPLQFTLYMNANAKYFYQILLGDKDTFLLSWEKCQSPYKMVNYYCGLASNDSRYKNDRYQFKYEMNLIGFAQRDLEGKPLFFHMVCNKWTLDPSYKFLTTLFLVPEHPYTYIPTSALRSDKVQFCDGTTASIVSRWKQISLAEEYPWIKEKGFERLNIVKSLLSTQ